MSGGIVDGEICCANDGTLRYVIDNGAQQYAKYASTTNLCYSF